MDPVLLQLKMVASFERRLAVNASRPPLARSRPSISTRSEEESVRFLNLKAGFFNISMRELPEICVAEGFTRRQTFFSAYSITCVALFVGLREKRIRRKIIGKKMLKANTRNMYFMFAGGGFGWRSPFEVVVGSIVETILLSRKHSLAGCLSIIGNSGRRKSQRQVALRYDPARVLQEPFEVTTNGNRARVG